MHAFHRTASLLAALTLVAALGCASTKVTAVDAPMQDQEIPRPDRIIVHDFAATPDAIPADSSLAGEVEEPSEPMTAEELEAGRKLGAAVATQLVKEIEDMGLHAVRADGQPSPRPGDVVMRGYFLSIDEGSTLKRMVVGFGSGSAELKTVVEAYLMTERGLRRVGSGSIDSGGSKMPGVVLPLAVTLATANPIGLAVGGAVKVAGEVSGHDKIEGAGKRTAQEIAKELRPRLEQRGWIAKE
jgi:hypothetical protein